MDKNAMYKLSYGLFVITAKDGDKDNGFISNTAIQAAFTPDKISICVNKGNFTHDMIMRTGEYTVSVISKEATFDLFKHFGFQSGKDVNKFSDFADCARGANGVYYITKGTNAYISVKVSTTVDLGSHSMFVGEITDMQVLSDKESATYDYYLNKIKPKPDAVGTTSDGKTIWRCRICGHEYVGEEIPEDYICPVCNHPASYFDKVSSVNIIDVDVPSATSSIAAVFGRTVADFASMANQMIDAGISNLDKVEIIKKTEDKTMTKWVCPVCGYVHEGPEAPEECPVCHVKGATWKKMDENMKLAAEHEYGVYAKTVKNNPNVSDEDKKYIFEQLMANFKGECSEVGMYLCMARIAHREGYPEIGLYWEKAAYEEAEHAAKFAELLGEDLEPNMKATTKDNLAWRVDCEYGATQGKFDLALCCKKNDLDALHDTIHEMARDEARHGKALEGMLKRYFK